MLPSPPGAMPPNWQVNIATFAAIDWRRYGVQINLKWTWQNEQLTRRWSSLVSVLSTWHRNNEFDIDQQEEQVSPQHEIRPKECTVYIATPNGTISNSQFRQIAYWCRIFLSLTQSGPCIIWNWWSASPVRCRVAGTWKCWTGSPPVHPRLRYIQGLVQCRSGIVEEC